MNLSRDNLDSWNASETLRSTLRIEDITPPPLVAHLPSVLAVDNAFGSMSRLEALRRRNVVKYRWPGKAPHTLGTHPGWSDMDMDLSLERMLLCIVASLGIGVNLIFLISLLARRAFRNMSYAFMLHGVIVDIAKAFYAVLYALNIHASKDIVLLTDHEESGTATTGQITTMGSAFINSASKWLVGSHGSQDEPADEHICTVIGTTYIIVVTVSIINLIAILCTETYIFTDDNLFILKQRVPGADHSQDSPAIVAHAPASSRTRTQPTARRLRHYAPVSTASSDERTDRTDMALDNQARKPPRRKRRKSGKESADELDSDFDESGLLVQPHRAYSLNYCCVLFAICIIYICSLILHLGPTIIAGQFDMNNAQDEFYCNMVTGEIRNYISYLMWLFIITLTMFGACYYASVFYRYVASYSDHRVMGLVRASVFIASGGGNTQDVHSSSEALIRIYKNRAVVLITVIISYALCYYPLFFLILSSRRLAHPTVLYKAFRIISLSNPIFTPAIYLTIDEQLRPKGFKSCYAKKAAQRKPVRRRQHGDATTSTQSSQVSVARTSQRLFTAGSNDTRTVKADATLREVFVNLDAENPCNLPTRIQMNPSAVSRNSNDLERRVSREQRLSLGSTERGRVADCYEQSPVVTERSRYVAASRGESPLFRGTDYEHVTAGSVRRNTNTGSHHRPSIPLRTVTERGAYEPEAEANQMSCVNNSFASTDVDGIVLPSLPRPNLSPTTRIKAANDHSAANRALVSRISSIAANLPSSSVDPDRKFSGLSSSQTDLDQPFPAAPSNSSLWRDAEIVAPSSARTRRRDFAKQTSSSRSGSLGFDLVPQTSNSTSSYSVVPERCSRNISAEPIESDNLRDLPRIEESSVQFGNETSCAYLYGNVYEQTGIAASATTGSRRSLGNMTPNSDTHVLGTGTVVQFRMNL